MCGSISFFAAVKNHHTFSGLNGIKWLYYNCRGQKSEVSCLGCILSEGSRRGCFSLSWLNLEATCIHWFICIKYIFCILHIQLYATTNIHPQIYKDLCLASIYHISFHCHISSLTPILLLTFYEDTCDYIGPAEIIQENLSISRTSTKSHLQRPSPHKVTD